MSNFVLYELRYNWPTKTAQFRFNKTFNIGSMSFPKNSNISHIPQKIRKAIAQPKSPKRIFFNFEPQSISIPIYLHLPNITFHKTKKVPLVEGLVSVLDWHG